MTIQDFSDGFDTLLNSYSNRAEFGEEISRRNIAFDEYEKSQFLTMAQEEIVEGLYSGRNSLGESFESSEEMRRYLADLVVERTLKPIVNYHGFPLGMEGNSKFFTLPEDVWFLTYESVVVKKGKCQCGESMRVYPTKQDEYQSIKDNPFRGANDRRALRLDLSEGNVEIICKYTVTDYYIRYIKRLSPIILVDLSDGLSIEGESQASECKLHQSLHQRILERAVVKALQSQGISLDNKESGNN